MDKKIMNACNWEVIVSFNSPNEFKRFSAWLRAQVASELAKEVPVNELQSWKMFDEKWFLCVECGEIWRLVAPQAPFLGCWELVNAVKKYDGSM